MKIKRNDPWTDESETSENAIFPGKKGATSS